MNLRKRVERIRKQRRVKRKFAAAVADGWVVYVSGVRCATFQEFWDALEPPGDDGVSSFGVVWRRADA